MKTNPTTQPFKSFNQVSENAEESRLAKYGRLFLGATAISLGSIAAAPQAAAAPPNGTYEFSTVRGSVKFGGDTIEIPPYVAKRIANVTRGEITVRNKSLKLNKNATARIVNNLADDLNLDVDTTVSGPSALILTKDGTTFEGSTDYPIMTKIEGSFRGIDFSGQLDTDVRATVKGKALRIVITFSGEAIGERFSGKLIVLAER